MTIIRDEEGAMGLPDDTTLRTGDIVLVRAKMRHDRRPGENAVHLDIAGASSTYASMAAIVSIERRHFKKGERVRYDGNEGTVLASHDAYLWIELDGLCPVSVPAKACELVATLDQISSQQLDETIERGRAL